MKAPLLARLERMLPSQRILADRASLMAYECDGFPLERQSPVAVVFPDSTDEVREIVSLCNELSVPFLARGSGTSLSGSATPGAEGCVILALAGMKRVLEIDVENARAIVQPGLINQRLSEAAAPFGLYYAPDPSSQTACTLGGNVALNSGGPHCFKYGMTTDHVLGLTIVLGSGEVLKLYEGDGPDLVGLVTGHEGTFGVVTEIELRLCPAPAAVRTWLASYSSMDAACNAVTEIVASGIVPAALEILDRLTIEAVEASVYAAGYPTDAAAVLLVELDGTELAIDADTPEVERLLSAHEPLDLESTDDPSQRARLWKGRKGAFGAMGRLDNDLYVLDGVVPRSRLQPVLAATIAIAERHGVKLSNVFHAGDGNLHPNLSFDSRNDDQRRRVIAAGAEILRLCVDEGGSITGEHGVGNEKMDYMGYMFSETDLEVFRDIKSCFDPAGLCNPGKIYPTGGSCAEGKSAQRPGALDA